MPTTKYERIALPGPPVDTDWIIDTSNFMQQCESELDQRTIPALKNIPVPMVPPIAGRRMF